MIIKRKLGVFEIITSNWILTIGQCWIDKSFGFVFFPKEGQIKIKKILKIKA